MHFIIAILIKSGQYFISDLNKSNSYYLIQVTFSVAPQKRKIRIFKPDFLLSILYHFNSLLPIGADRNYCNWNS